MENQTTIFDMLYPKKKITKPIRLIECFAGYGSQALALKYLGVPFEHWKTCEWAIKSIQAYKDIHFSDDDTDYSKGLTKEEIINVLHYLGISQNYNEPMKLEQIKRLNENELRKIYNNIVATCNLVNIQKVKGKDLEIVDTDKYEYIMTYSFPCQDLSLAGKGKGMSDTTTRSGMLWEVERILTECENKPQILLMENVPQVKTNDPLAWERWLSRLEELGYKNYHQDLIATDYGIPQTRNRTFMISLLGDYNYTFPKPIPLKLKLKDMLEDNVDEKYYLSDKRLNILTRNVEIKDKKNFIIGSSQKHTCINYDGICPTLTSAMGKGGGQTPMIPIKPHEELKKLLNEYENIDDDEILKKGKIKYEIFKKFGTNKRCFRCNSQLLISDLPEYDYLCFECDENMYDFEAIDYKTPQVIGGIGEKDSNNNTQWKQQNRIYDNNVAISITTAFNPYYKTDLRIRKLTPKECGRLMGCKDEDIDKIQLSDSAKYHIFGDAIVINVLMAIFKELI